MTDRMKASTSDHHTATLLDNGKVLLIGRGNVTIGPGFVTAPCAAQLFNPATQTFSCPGMTGSHMHHTATLLANGMVLVAGGITEELVVRDSGYSSMMVITNTAEMYDPATETFTLVDGMIYERAHHTATLLSSDEVLIVGGRDDAGALREAEVFHP